MLAVAGCAAEPADEALRAADASTGRICTSGELRCLAHVQIDPDGRIASSPEPLGFTPRDLEAAYDIPTELAGDPPTIGIVDAYGAPDLESDLAAYRAQFGLPPCTIANGCLRIVSQRGDDSLPPPPPATDDWSIETALDVDMASAACPSCNLLVVLADDDHSDGLFVATAKAAELGATVVSDSWGGLEDALEPAAMDHYLDHPGVAIFVASGDAGWDSGGLGAQYPATSPHAIAVGGTSLYRDGKGGFYETAWAQGGSSCSSRFPKPSWQPASPCNRRANADVSAIADAQTPVAVYTAHGGGWLACGGTSASSPLVAALFAATGNGAITAEDLATGAANMNDVRFGSNGACGSVLCEAGPGWDGPTGWGTPDGGRWLGADHAAREERRGGGCAVGRASGAWIALALLALRRRRRCEIFGRAPSVLEAPRARLSHATARTNALATCTAATRGDRTRP
jgi:hypothetical protein